MLRFDHFTNLQLGRDPAFQATLDTVYDGVTPGDKELDQFTRREILLARVDGDSGRLREIESRNIRLSDGELDDNYHEVNAMTD